MAVISAAWGLGENVVQGTVNPDKYLVFKPLLGGEGRHRPIVEKALGAKEKKMVYAEGGSARTRNVNTTRRERASFVLGDDEILQLGRWAAIIEAHYRRAINMEWGQGRRGRPALRSRPGPRRCSRPGNRRCSRATA